MKVFLSIAAIVLVLGLIGCTPTMTPVIIPTKTPIPAIIPASPVQPESEIKTETRLVNDNWVSPAEIDIGNYYSGAKAEWKIKIHNGNDIWTKFLLSYLTPTDTKEGYSMPPEGTQDWVIIADATPMLSPKETREISVTLAIPKGTKVDEKQWEFWTVVIEQGQGNIQVQTATRWLVNMR